MRDYSKIGPAFWIGKTGKAIRKCGIEAQLIALYVLSSPHANMIGLYHLPIDYIVADTGCPLEGASKALTKLHQCGFLGYDEASEMVWVYEMAKYQISDRLKPDDKRCAGVQNLYDEIPENRFLAEFYDKYSLAFNLKTKRETASPSEAPPKPLRSQEQEQEQEQEQKNLPAVASRRQAAKDDSVLQTACRETWRAYSAAYFDRYHTEPVRNAKVNSSIKGFVQRVGGDEAPQVAAFYLGHDDAFYVRKCHDASQMLADAEKLRTEWATNRRVTGTQARQAEQAAANYANSQAAMELLNAGVI